MLEAEKRERTKLTGRLSDAEAALGAEKRAHAEIVGRLGEREAALEAEKRERTGLARSLGGTEAVLRPRSASGPDLLEGSAPRRRRSRRSSARGQTCWKARRDGGSVRG